MRMKMPRLGGSYVAAGAFSFLPGIYNLKVQEHQKQHALKKVQEHQKQYALKGQKLLAQGNALGIAAVNKAPWKGKSFVCWLEFESFCPYYYICTWKNKEVKIFISANFC